MPSVLVTGGAGFIGSAVVRRLLEGSSDGVLVVDSLTYAGNRSNLPEHPRLSFAHQDIGDPRAARTLLARHNCRTVLNLAAESHVDRSIERPSAFYETNVQGVLSLLEASFDYWQGLPANRASEFRFIQVSTDEVYGPVPAPGSSQPGDVYRPSSPYSASKAAADHLVHSYRVTFGLPTSTVMLSNCYGQRQFPEKLLPLMICRALAGESLPLYGDGRQQRQWLHVDDAARGLEAVLRHAAPGDVHHLSGDDVLANRELVERLCAALTRQAPDTAAAGAEQRIKNVTDRPGHDQRYALDSQASREKLHWTPIVTLDEGLQQTVAWYLRNPDWINHALHRAMYHRERLGVRA